MTLVVPCYNERELLDQTIPPLFAAVAAEVPGCEMILVDNGSTDGTGEIVARLCGIDARIRLERVPVNRGYGLGVLTGYRNARGRCIGHLPSDGPVAPADVAALARRALTEGPGALVSAVRRHRQDTAVRRWVSRSYNVVFFTLFGNIGDDINGTPKFLHAADVERLAPSSEDYFLEAEMMIKARRLGLRIVSVEVDSCARTGGRSKVSARLFSTCAEFLRNLLRARFGSLALPLVFQLARSWTWTDPSRLG